jgi:hypothetical protein
MAISSRDCAHAINWIYMSWSTRHVGVQSSIESVRSSLVKWLKGAVTACQRSQWPGTGLAAKNPSLRFLCHLYFDE